MSKYEKGNLPAQNTVRIVNSVRRCLESNDIEHLTEAAYKHITLHMGFIAHYSLLRFKDTYDDVSHFAKRLLMSECSNDVDYNRKDANRYLAKRFTDDYGKAYCQSVVDCNNGIVELAEKHIDKLTELKNESVKSAELAELNRLAEKHGAKIS